MKLSPVQLEALSILDGCADGFAEPGEIWREHSSYEYTSHLGMLNFGRTMDALARRKLVERDDYGYVITDAGRAALKNSEGEKL